MNIAEQFPRPLQLDRVVFTDPNSSYYGQTGVLIYMPHDALKRLRALVVPDSNPKLQVPVDQFGIVHERFASELAKIKRPKRSIKAEVVEQAASEETVTEVTVIPTASLRGAEPPGKLGNSIELQRKRGKPRTTNIVTEELGNAALLKYQAGIGMVAIASEMNLNPAELSAYFKAKDVVLKKGKRIT